ncbi:sigma-70 family RNA polymerase sigma factor, partial [Tessaracoccus caeni]|uniref:sigma-70 family RNA polymerase sigma factor n=1 Tax=Tessaracoccus caeni TaxID=3031239 RepID=UPI0023DBB590
MLRIAAGTSSTFDPEDLAAESFTRIWAALRDGSGPTQAFLPYARTVVRNVAATWAGRSQEVPTEQDQLEFESQQIYVPNSFEESLSEHELVSSAFATLPGRWQSVLWMTEVEGKRAADIAVELDLTPNAAAALSKRAREALSRAWLQEQVDTRAKEAECRWVLGHVGGHVRRSLSAPQKDRVETHLMSCAGCERATRRIAHIGSSLRLIALLAGGSMSGVAAWVAAGTAAPATAAAATPQGGSSGGTSGGASSGSAGGAAAGSAAGSVAGNLAARVAMQVLRPLLGASTGATVAGIAGVAAAAVIVGAVVVPRLSGGPAEANSNTTATVSSQIPGTSSPSTSATADPTDTTDEDREDTTTAESEVEDASDLTAANFVPTSWTPPITLPPSTGTGSGDERPDPLPRPTPTPSPDPTPTTDPTPTPTT